VTFSIGASLVALFIHILSLQGIHQLTQKEYFALDGRGLDLLKEENQ
jgi:hypothetical protein